MFDLRPVAYVIGLLACVLGLTMLVPMALDFADGSSHGYVFLQAGMLSVLAGGLTALTCSNGVRDRLSIQQTFLLTTGVWLALPVFGALPFWFGAPEARFVDAFFEAMSGLTTTGATVFTGLEDMPRGILLWRGLLQWFGGVGIVVVAMVFLPELRVGGMQIFRSEGFDTFGKILPRATEIARQISVIYAAITALCALAYIGAGLSAFDAIVHAMTTVATGGFSNYDASFAAFPPAVEYTAVVFMVLAALPFVRFVQLVGGSGRPLFSDPQVRTFMAVAMVLAAIVAAWLVFQNEKALEVSLRKALFNTISLLTGTGFASDDYMLWGPFPIALLFFVGLIGGCAGSTSCSIKMIWMLLMPAYKCG